LHSLLIFCASKLLINENPSTPTLVNHLQRPSQLGAGLSIKPTPLWGQTAPPWWWCLLDGYQKILFLHTFLFKMVKESVFVARVKN
jgi:hypothetical protein